MTTLANSVYTHLPAHPIPNSMRPVTNMFIPNDKNQWLANCLQNPL